MSGSFPHLATDLPAGHTGRASSPGFGTPHRLVIDGRRGRSPWRALSSGEYSAAITPAERVMLLTSELVTNSVNHSDSRLPGGTVAVTVRAGADRVLVEVADDGGTTVPALRRDDDLGESGRGLRLVDAFSLDWNYYRSAVSTVTWFECLPAPLP
jgi:hypothetical protein